MANGMDASQAIGLALSGLVLGVGALLGGLSLQSEAPGPAAPDEDGHHGHGTTTSRQPAGGPIPTAEALVADCRAKPPMLGCIEAGLQDVLAGHGAPAAFLLLDQVTRIETSVQVDQHNVAHRLGRLAISVYDTPRDALRDCPTTMASGCFHGVLEEHFHLAGPPQDEGDVTTLCSEDDGRYRFFQCLHGLGHGLGMVAYHDLPKAVAWCDLFNDSWQESSCVGGAFMENIVADVSMEHAHGDKPAVTWQRLNRTDPTYPCNQFEERWWHSCYWLQSSAYFQLGMGVREAFRACDQAPVTELADYRNVCYESMGRDISGRTLRDGPSVLRECQLGNATRLPHCIFGAVQEIVNDRGSAEPGFAFCPTVPEESKSLCYRGVGIMLQSIETDPKARFEACMQVVVEYRDECLVSATNP